MMVKHLPKQHADNGAILVGAIVEVLVILKVPEQLALTATEVATLGGLGLIIAGTVRSIWRSRRAAKAEGG